MTVLKGSTSKPEKIVVKKKCFVRVALKKLRRS
jgi:hypothetical protein